METLLKHQNRKKKKRDEILSIDYCITKQMCNLSEIQTVNSSNALMQQHATNKEVRKVTRIPPFKPSDRKLFVHLVERRFLYSELTGAIQSRIQL